MSKTNQKSQKPKNTFNKYAQFSGIGIQMFAIIALGTYLGVKLDEKFPNERNLWTIFLSLFSVIFSIIFVIRRIIAASKNDD